ncbi:MAG: rhomboid family intramembrane serine protease [Pseudomonadota bacterium]
MNWRDLSQFPQSTLNDDWRVRKGRTVECVGIEHAKKEFACWRVLNRNLVLAPGSHAFLPAILIEGYASDAHGAFILACRKGMLTLFVAILMLYMVSRSTSLSLAGAIQANIALLAIAVFDHLTVVRNITALQERELFGYWVRTQSRTDMYFWTAVMLVAGGIQLLMQERLHGVDELLVRFGAYFPALAQGEYWRVLTGPFLHASLAHWLSNFLSLIPIAMITARICRKACIPLFLVGSAIGVLFVFVFQGHHDAICGVSAGIFALTGFIIMIGFRFPEHFPSHFYKTVLVLSAGDMIIAQCLMPSSSLVAHIAGMLTGIIVGYLLPTSAVSPEILASNHCPNKFTTVEGG